MKISLKTIVLIALLAFFIIIVLSNFSNLEGFVGADSSVLSESVSSQASEFHKEKDTTIEPTKSIPVPTSTSSGK